MSLHDDAVRLPEGRVPLHVAFRAPFGLREEDDGSRPRARRAPAPQLVDVGRPPALHAVAPPTERDEDLRIVVHSDGADDLLTVSGEVDIATVPALYTVLRQLLAEGRRRVAVDLEAVTFLDATAITFVLAAGRDLAAAGGSLTVLGHNPLLQRLLAVAGLTGAMDL